MRCCAIFSHWVLQLKEAPWTLQQRHRWCSRSQGPSSPEVSQTTKLLILSEERSCNVFSDGLSQQNGRTDFTEDLCALGASSLPKRLPGNEIICLVLWKTRLGENMEINVKQSLFFSSKKKDVKFLFVFVAGAIIASDC